MAYRVSSGAKVIQRTALLLVAITILGAVFWFPLKRAYFAFVTDRCTQANGLGSIKWVQIPYFDARAERFLPASEPERATLDCMTNWAGVIIEDSPLPNTYDGPDKAHLDRLEGDMQVDARPGHMRLLYYSE